MAELLREQLLDTTRGRIVSSLQTGGLLVTTAQTGVPALTSYRSMKRQSLTPAVFVIVLATGGLPAAAQSTNTNNAAPVEVTPYASLGSYPSPRVGAAVAFRLTPTLSVETEVGYRRDTTGRLSATASLLYDLPRIGRQSGGARARAQGLSAAGAPHGRPRRRGRRPRRAQARAASCAARRAHQRSRCPHRPHARDDPLRGRVAASDDGLGAVSPGPRA
jgi:hypothetical protein